MKKYILSVVALLFSAVMNLGFAQKFTVLDTVEHEGRTLEMVSVPLDGLDINPKRDNYLKLVSNAMKMGLTLCPSDPRFLSRVSRKVWLDSDHYKFQVLVATAPYAQPGIEPAFFIPTIVACSDDRQEVKLYFERVGLFYPEEYPDPFLPLEVVSTLGYSSPDTGFIAYDWIFLRVIPQS